MYVKEKTSDSVEINYYIDQINYKEVIKDKNLENVTEALNICNLSKVEDRYHTWVKLMPRVKPYYAIKCNYDQQIVQTLADLGANFDCASMNEISQVLEYGVSQDRLIYGNPCKPISHLLYAKEHNVKTTIVDNEFEVLKMYTHFPEANLIIRFRCDAKTAKISLGAKYGCNAERDAGALMLLANSLNLNVVGTAFHVGSDCSEFEVYERAIEISKNLFMFGELLNFKMNIVDIGGGFPGKDADKFIEIAQAINKALEEHFPDESVSIVGEPGRYFADSAFTLVCKVLAKREIHVAEKLSEIMYFINESIYGMFIGILLDHQTPIPLHLLEDDSNLPKFKSIIWGPTCDSWDKIAENVYLPHLHIGDYLVFENLGSYSLPLASSFNGFDLPMLKYYKKIDENCCK